MPADKVRIVTGLTQPVIRVSDLPLVVSQTVGFPGLLRPKVLDAMEPTLTLLTIRGFGKVMVP